MFTLFGNYVFIAMYPIINYVHVGISNTKTLIGVYIGGELQVDENYHHPSMEELRWIYIGHKVQLWHIAHYEAREDIYGREAVIVIGFHPKNITTKPPLYCCLIYSNGIKICLHDQANWFEFLRSTPKPNEIYVAYNLMWKLPTKQAGVNLKSIRVSTNASCTPSSEEILVFNDTLNKTGTIGLCMHKALFKFKDPQRIASWIELNLAMGVELISLYYHDVSPEEEKVVQFYVDTGKVEVINWTINISNSLVYNTGQLGTIQDCFYRNYHRFKYIMFHDIDEVIVPRKHISLQGMMKEIDKGNHIGYFRFYNSFWHDVGEIMAGANTTRLCPQLDVPIFFRSTHRSIDEQIPKWSRHKIIIKPKACYRIDIHNVKIYVTFMHHKNEKCYETNIIYYSRFINYG